MVIAIEGMDGCGKTTISKKIVDKLNYIYVDKPLRFLFSNDNTDGYEELMSLAQKVYDVEDDLIRAWFIGMGSIVACRMYENKDIIIDRHLLSNYFWNGSENSEKAFDAIINIIGKPDLTIILYASPEDRYKRIYSRDKNDPDLKDPEKFVDGYNKMIYFAEQKQLNYVILDTTNKSIDEVLNMSLDIINNYIEKNIVKEEYKRVRR